MNLRSTFILLLLLPAALSAATTDVRILAANLTSGNFQSYPNPGPGVRIMQGLQPDIVLIQEFNVNSTSGGPNDAAAVEAWVDSVFGAEFEWFRESGAQIPNGVISRYPILDAGVWEDTFSPNREYVWAQIDVPGDIDLWAVSLHLLTDNGSRPQEAAEVVAFIQANIPAGDYLTVGGDLNTGSRGESAVTTLGQVVVTSAPYPVDQDGDGDTNEPRNEPYDWVLADPDLDAKEIPVVIGTNTFDNGLVLDTAVYTPLSEVAPAQFGDSHVSGMQHMAVVRDFRIDGEGGNGGGNGGGATIDLSGFQLVQSNSDLTLTFPPQTDLAAGASLVIGRMATEGEFEGFHGPLPEGAVYINGFDLVGSNGFPLINGEEEYVLRDDQGTAIDPPSGTVPLGGVAVDSAYQRDSVLTTNFTQVEESQASPGVFSGIRTEAGGLVITEISDASDFHFEFVELTYDFASGEAEGLLLR